MRTAELRVGLLSQLDKSKALDLAAMRNRAVARAIQRGNDRQRNVDPLLRQLADAAFARATII